MNRDLTHAGGRDGRAQIAAQTRAVYALMDRVRAAHPGVEIESCASGGGRIDYGALARTHRVWTSDCTDALERLEIQRGASVFVPPEILGSHISASPNHQTGRRHTLSFRALVAIAYHLGVELNPLELTEDERSELKVYIEAYKRLRGLLHAPGAAFRLEPIDGRYVWGAASAEKIVVIVAQGPQMVGEQPAPLRLPDSITELGGTWRIANVLPAAPQFIRISEGQTKLLAGEISFQLSNTGLGRPATADADAGKRAAPRTRFLSREARPMADVRLRDVKKQFGALSVIKGVDLDVEDGEFCVFVGPSGCGKSTLLRMIAGLEDITAGALSIGGQDMTEVGPSERGVAMVFQSYALYPHMTVAENIGFGLRMTGHPKDEITERTAVAAKMLQLEPLLERKPGQLSGGQRQRVAIGRAIVRNPEVFLFDEPLSNLDAALRVQMRSEIVEAAPGPEVDDDLCHA